MDNGFRNRKVMITGATGLIGKRIVSNLIEQGATVVIVVRSEEKAKSIWGTNVQYIISDITKVPLQNINVEYIIHAAACTSSKDFVDNPVNVIKTNFFGTLRMLDFAKMNAVKKFVYLSSMEVYGTPSTDEKIDEEHESNLNTMSVRSSYPESKRICECLSASYSKQYDVPINVVRLTQTFGEGVKYSDNRVFAEFARCAIEGRDITLHTKGETKRSYLYVDDASNGILNVLLHGKTGEAYNIANEDTYCSIYDMALLVAEKCSKHPIKVLIESEETSNNYGYAPTLKMNLDTTKIRELGWKPCVGLQEMFQLLIEDMKKGLTNE